MISIRSDRGEMTAESCAATPMWDAPDASVTCTEEGSAWHRTGGGAEEYVAVRAGASIRVIGANAPVDDIRAAAEAVRMPSDADLAQLFADLPTAPPAPVERGDLPHNGDEAPVDPVGPGG